MQKNKTIKLFLTNRCVSSKRQTVQPTRSIPKVGDGIMILDMAKTNRHFRLERINETHGGWELELLPIKTLAAYVMEHVERKECYIITLKKGSEKEYVFLEPDFP